MSDIKSKWIAAAGIAIGAIVIFVAGGLVGAYVYNQMQPDEPVRHVVVQPRALAASGGVVVLAVEPDSQAENAGFEPGDVLLSVNGEEIDSTVEVRQSLEALKAGDELTFTVVREGEEMEFRLVLEADPSQTPLGLRICCDPSSPSFMFEGTHLGQQVLIMQVVPDSAAEEAGLQSGDRILEVNGVEVDAGKELSDMIAAFEPGEEITLTIQRRESTQSEQIGVTLGEHPEQPGRAYLGVRYTARLPRVLWIEPGGRGDLLLPGPDLSEILKNYEELKDHLHFLPECGSLRLFEGQETQGTCGLVVAQIDEGSPAEEAGLQPGDLILAAGGETIQSQQAFVEFIQSHNPGDEITLKVFRPDAGDELEMTAVLGEDPEQEGAAYLGVTVPGFYFHFTPENWQLLEWNGDRFHFEIPPFESTAAAEHPTVG